MAASATLALKAGVWFRRGRLLIISPVQQPSWLLSGRNPTYPVVQIPQATSLFAIATFVGPSWMLSPSQPPKNAGHSHLRSLWLRPVTHTRLLRHGDFVARARRGRF